MLKTALMFCLAASIGLVTAGCADVCDDAEEACRGCGNDAEYCSDRTAGCRILSGPAENDCCELLLDDWEQGC